MTDLAAKLDEAMGTVRDYANGSRRFDLDAKAQCRAAIIAFAEAAVRDVQAAIEKEHASTTEHWPSLCPENVHFARTLTELGALHGD